MRRDAPAFHLSRKRSPLSAALHLFEPELYHGSGPAYFGSLIKRDNARPIHACYPVEELPTWLKLVDPARDTFVSQAEFFAPKRRIATLRSIGLVWADCGDDGRLAELGERAAVHRILKAVDDAGIPEPSIIVSSGRGYHPKWLFDKGVPSRALPRWTALERAVTAALRDDLDADPKATDAARVLRLAGTVNTRNGKVAGIVHRRDLDSGEPLRYDFEQLCRDILRYDRPGIAEQATKTRKRAATGFRTYTVGTLWWGRYYDLMRLCELRGWTAMSGGVPQGFRDIMLFFFAVALSWVALPQNWWHEVLAIAALYTPTLKDHERRGFVGSVYRRLLDARNSEWGHGRYKYSTARIIQDLGISVQEMRSLKHLVLPDMAAARKRELNEQNKARVRAEVSERLSVAKALRNEKIHRMANEGTSVALIASTLGISRQTVYNVLTVEE